MVLSRPPTPSSIVYPLKTIREDKWTSDPPSVTSYLTYSRSEPSDDQYRRQYRSPTCGFGWRFHLEESFRYRKSASNNRAQELVGRISVTLLPHKCTSMSLSDFQVRLKVSYTGKPGHENQFQGVSITLDTGLGTYAEPAQYKGPVTLEISLVFSKADGLSLPTTPSTNISRALLYSLDQPAFVDTKVYLFSARVNGEPACPKAIYVKSQLLVGGSNYLRDLFSSDSDFAQGSACDLCRDVPEEIEKLNSSAYDYEDDSDLEDEPVNTQPKVILTGSPDGPHQSVTDPGSSKEGPNEVPHEPDVKDGRAFAINGTAYKTWKAFLFYTYTNTIKFDAFKSTPFSARGMNQKEGTVTCSPKSMYRFADYADLPELKELAREGIRKNLSHSNIIQELFSVFTSKYEEIIELEVDFLARIFNGSLSIQQDFDKILRTVVQGAQPHCFRVLAFTLKRLLGDDVQSAWASLDTLDPSSRLPTPIFSDHSSFHDVVTEPEVPEGHRPSSEGTKKKKKKSAPLATAS